MYLLFLVRAHLIQWENRFTNKAVISTDRERYVSSFTYEIVYAKQKKDRLQYRIIATKTRMGIDLTREQDSGLLYTVVVPQSMF